MLSFRKRTSPWIWFGLIAVALVAFLLWQFIAFQFALNKVPPGWTVAGADVAGKTYQQAVKQVGETLTQQPVQLAYRDQKLTLQPGDIQVSFNPTDTLESIVAARSASGDAQGFLTYIIRHAPPPQNIPPVMSWSDESLRTYLAQVANQYDLRPQAPTPLLDTLRMAPGRPGYELDVSGSMAEIAAAIRSGDSAKRQVTLKIKQIPPPRPAFEALDVLTRASLGGFDGIAGIFIKDLASGESYGYNDDVAFSGMGILKIAIMVGVYHKHIHLPAEDQALVEEMIGTESGNGAANALLQKLGLGDAYAGGRDMLTPAMKYLGLVNTFMVTPYDQDAVPLAVVTPANSRSDISTLPDAKMQSTPRDIGLLLDMIYDCSAQTGALLVAYPNNFAPDECQHMLDIMASNRLNDRAGQPAYLQAGLLAGASLAHKYSWSDNVRADAGIVFSPGRDYVIVVFLYSPQAGPWDQVNPVFTRISQAAYQFFNATPAQPTSQTAD